MTAEVLPRVVYSINEVAQMVGRSPRCVRHWCEQGHIDAMRIGGRSHWLIPAKVVDDLRNGAA